MTDTIRIPLGASNEIGAPGHVALVRELMFARLTDHQVSARRDTCRIILAGLPGAPAED